MSKYDRNAQSWVNNPTAWQDHEEDHVAEQFKSMFGGYWKQVSFIVQCCICGGIAGSILGYWWVG